MAKYYAVREGRKIGVFESWEECEAQVKGYKGADFKSFSAMWLADDYMNGIIEKVDKPMYPLNIGAEIYVDGSFMQDKGYAWAYAFYFDGELKHYEYGVGTNKEAALMRNVAGELSAAMHAADFLSKKNITQAIVYHDYIGIALWADGSWKTKDKFSKAYYDYMLKKQKDHNFQFVHVEGHTNIAGNELVDSLCRQAFKEVM